jgi:hypothetical protein
MEGRVLPVGVHLDHSQVRNGGEYILQFTGLIFFHHMVNQPEIAHLLISSICYTAYARIIHTPGNIFNDVILGHFIFLYTQC